jgi:hypothetical protein
MVTAAMVATATGADRSQDRDVLSTKISGKKETSGLAPAYGVENGSGSLTS